MLREISTATVLQIHARVLREALAKLTKLGQPMVTKIAIEALRNYAIMVGPTCSHTDTSFIAAENKAACLDCGKRFYQEVAQQEQFYLAPPKTAETTTEGEPSVEEQ